MTNDNGINDIVTDQEILSQVKFMLKIVNTNEHDTYLLQAINDGVRQLRNNFSLIPLIAQLQIDKQTLSVQVPKGFYELRGRNPIRTFSGNVKNAIAPSVPTDGFYKGQFNDIEDAKVVNGYIYFGSAVTDTMCQISFLGLNVDSNGNLSIPRIADLAVRFYAMAQFYLLEGNPLYSEFMRRFRHEKRFVRGEYARSDSQDQKLDSEGINKFNVNTNYY